MKLPQHIVRDLFYRTVKSSEQVKTSSIMLHRGCCPLCNDYKKRMYLKEYPDHYLIYCHNCGYSHKLEVFLKANFPEEYAKLKPYVIDSMRTGSFFKTQIFNRNDEPTLDAEDVNKKLSNYIPDISFNIMEYQDNNYLEQYRMLCLKYLDTRKIPMEIYQDFLCIYKGKLAGYIGIPFWDKEKKNMIHIQGRLVVKRSNVKQEKYLFIKDEDNGIEIQNKSLWGMWRVDESDEVVICEGTLDACAFDNGIATCGATISDYFIEDIIKKYKNRIWCVDNYFLDTAGRDLTNRLLVRGEKCFIIPKKLTGIKDANQLLTEYFKEFDYIPMDFVRNNTYEGKIGLSKLKLQIQH